MGQDKLEVYLDRLEREGGRSPAPNSTSSEPGLTPPPPPRCLLPCLNANTHTHADAHTYRKNTHTHIRPNTHAQLEKAV